MARDGTATRNRILDTAQRIVLERGFAATSVDAVLSGASVTKGAFFHHFRSKEELGFEALLERYAAMDLEMLDTVMAAAEAEADDPAEQLIAFLRGFEEASDELAGVQPGCLFVSFIYEHQLDGDAGAEIIVDTIRIWRERLLEKLEAAAAVHPPATEVDLPSLADQVFTTFEGGFILARALDDPSRLRAQLSHLRHYLQLLFGLQLP